MCALLFCHKNIILLHISSCYCLLYVRLLESLERFEHNNYNHHSLRKASLQQFTSVVNASVQGSLQVCK